jgi:hypothetical protein
MADERLRDKEESDRKKPHGMHAMNESTIPSSATATIKTPHFSAVKQHDVHESCSLFLRPQVSNYSVLRPQVSNHS